MPVNELTRRRLRVILPVLATVLILAPLAWLWQASRLPPSTSVMDMGYLDYGGAAPVGHDHASGRPVTDTDRRPGAPGQGQGRPGGPTGAAHRRRPVDRRLHAERHLARADDHRHPGGSGGGAPEERVGDRRDRAALARRRRAERDGRGGRRHPGRGAGRRRVHLPVRRRAAGHLLVPLPPGLQRAGGRRTLRRAGHRAEEGRGQQRRRARRRPRLRRDQDDQRASRRITGCRRRPGARCASG